jgi:hypothetical protein
MSAAKSGLMVTRLSRSLRGDFQFASFSPVC